MTFNAMKNERSKAWQQICSKKEKQTTMNPYIKSAVKASIETKDPWGEPQ